MPTSGAAMTIKVDVPCNGCVACCLSDAVRLLPEDAGLDIKTEPHPFKRGERMIAHKPDGSCWYLGPGGCTIHSHKPAMCWSMDCAVVVSGYTSGRLRRMVKSGMLSEGMVRAGRSRLRAMKQRANNADERTEGDPVQGDRR